jgi:hypothetical protein
MASLELLYSKFSSLKGKYQALIAAKTSPTTPYVPTPTQKLNKPQPHKEGELKVIEFEGQTWKYFAKCFGGSWNRTHVTKEHQPGKGRSKNRKTTPGNNNNPPSPNTNVTNEANAASNTNLNMNFL